MAEKTRIIALDLLRGITVAAMIAVNNAGGSDSYAQLRHSVWNGLTFCDMVFPSFLFIVGVSTYISLSKTAFKYSWPLMAKIFRRTIIIILIGWGIHLLENVLKGHGFDVAHLRLTGVLPRIALCYFVASIVALSCRLRAVAFISVLLLVVYSCLLIWGDGFSNSLDNVLSRIDRSVLGASHLYTKQPVDPEGIAGTLSGIAHTLIGFCFGALLCNRRTDLSRRLLAVMAWGASLLLVGLSISWIMPLNKRVWSPTFVLVTCGIIALLLALISYIIDLRHDKAANKILHPFLVFGVNPLFLYVLSEVVAILISAWALKACIYGWLSSWISDSYLASAVYSLLFVLVMWIAGYPLYRRKIYIKI